MRDHVCVLVTLLGVFFLLHALSPTWGRLPRDLLP